MVGYREARLWSDEPQHDKSVEIDIRFVIEYHDADHRMVRSVTPEIFRPSSKAEIFRLPDLTINHEVAFFHIFSDHYAVKGTLKWVTSLDVALSQQIWGCVELSRKIDSSFWNYVGLIVTFGAPKRQQFPVFPAPPRPDTPPPPSPEIPAQPIPETPKSWPEPALTPPALAGEMMIADEHLGMSELFPFVYIKPWPRLAQTFVDQDFMQVPADVEETKIYQDLASAAGEEKCALAVAFIDMALSPNDEGGTECQFITPQSSLPAPYNTFLAFPPRLRQDCTIHGLNQWVREQFQSWDELRASLATPEAKTALTNLWLSVYVLMITMGYDHIWLSRLIHLLQVTHLISGVLSKIEHIDNQDNGVTLPNQRLTRMLQATLILPDQLFPVFTPPEQANPPAIQPYAVGAIRSVHYRPDQYLLGDVQRIEIVTQGETRQEVRRSLRQSENMQEEQQNFDAHITQTHDTTTADLINQVQKTLSDRVSATKVDNYQTDYGLPNTNSMTVTGNWWVQDQPAGGFLKDISKFARDVIERSVKALRQESLQRRKLRLFEEAEVTETRTLSNVDGNGDRQTVYRWVNRQYRLETKCSQDRLVFECFIDAPGQNLAQAVSKRCNIKITPPLSPEQLGVKTYRDLSPEPRNASSPTGPVYYLDVFDQYGIPPDDFLPTATKIISAGLMSRNPVCETRLDVPTGYIAMNATATIISFSKATQMQVILGGMSLTPQPDAPNIFKGDFSAAPNRNASQLWASVLCTAAEPTPAKATENSTSSAAEPNPDQSPQQGSTEFETYYAFSLQVQFGRSQSTLNNWQMKTYQKIQAAYQQALMSYNDTIKEQLRLLQSRPQRLLMDIVQDQIVQSAVALFVQTTVASRTEGAVTSVPRDFKPRYEQFLRNAFDWEGMAIELYRETEGEPSQHLEQSALISLLSPSAYVIDYIQAKQARLLLSVKPDYARSLLLAFRTGQIWPCEEDIAPCTSADLNIISLLQEQPRGPSVQGDTHDEWTITLPTEMIALSRHDPFS